MEKLRELTDPKSCLNKASDGELLFVLRGLYRRNGGDKHESV